MKLTYTITRDEYAAALESLLKQRRKSPANIIIFILMTFVQFGIAVFHAVQTRPSSQARLLLFLSASICAIQLVYQFSVRARARMRMQLDIRRGKIRHDFWQKQYLSLKDDVFTLRCGKRELNYDCAYFSGSRKLDTILLLNFTKGKSVHQLMVPYSAFTAANTAEDFLAQLELSKNSSILSAARSSIGPRPDQSEYSVAFSYDNASFCADQVKAARCAYLNRIGWTLSTISRLAAAIFLLYHLFSGSYESTAFLVFVVCIILLLIYPLLLAFSPLCRLFARNTAETTFCGLDKIYCTIDISGKTLFFRSDVFYNKIPMCDIMSVYFGKRITVFYLRNNSVITIPLSTAADKETARLARYVETSADVNWKNRTWKEKIS